MKYTILDLDGDETELKKTEGSCKAEEFYKLKTKCINHGYFELNKITKKQLEFQVSSDAGDGESLIQLVTLTGTQQEMEIVAKSLHFEEYIHWRDALTLIPVIGLKIINKKTKKIFYITNVDQYITNITLCSKNGEILTISKQELYNNFEKK